MKNSLQCSPALACFVLALHLDFAGQGISWAASDDAEQARVYVDKGKAAFGLGHFADAAAAYESAFALKPAPALLYNAAQAHRMAGHKERALELYQSYLRTYGKGGANRAESEQHITNLTKMLEDEKRVASAPPNAMAAEADPEPAASPPPAAPPASAAKDPQGSSSISVATAQAETNEEKPLTSKPWFWVGVGGAVVATTIVILALTMGGASDPSPTAGTIKGN